MLKAGMILQGGEHLFFFLSSRTTLKHILDHADLACLLLGWDATQHNAQERSCLDDMMTRPLVKEIQGVCQGALISLILHLCSMGIK